MQTKTYSYIMTTRTNRIFVHITFAVMVILLIVQVIFMINYISKSAKVIVRQFDGAVMRSMLNTAKVVEEQEVINILREIAKTDSPEAQRAKELVDNYDKGVVSHVYFPGEDGLQSLGAKGYQKDYSGKFKTSRVGADGKSTSTSGASKETFDQITQDAEQTRALMMEIFARRYAMSLSGDIPDRVDPEQIRSLLEEHFKDFDIDIPFDFAIVCQVRNIIFHFDEEEFVPNEQCYSLPILRNGMSGSQCLLVVHFHNKRDYYSRFYNFLIPIFGTMLALFILCVGTIIYLFQQQRTAEIQKNFIRNMTHELKTPISSVYLAAQMLSDQSIEKSPETTTRLASTVNYEAKRLVILIDQALQQSLLESDKLALSLKPMDIGPVVKKVVDNTQFKVETVKGGSISAHYEAEDPVAQVDFLHFTNVLYNLIDNAIKYSSKDRPLKIDITTKNKGHNLLIEIQDNGLGIKKEYIKHVFDKYFRVPTGDRHDIKGFGLGLSYVKNVVRRHHGTITVTSEVGVGTKFTISIPLLNQL